MTEPTLLPEPVRTWAEKKLGTLGPAPGSSADGPSRGSWRVVRADDNARFVIKIARTPAGYTRETFAYRHAVSALGAGNAPRLLATFPSHLALLLTDLPGLPLPGPRMKPAALRRIHWRSGALVARLHHAGRPTAADHEEATTALSRLADDAGPHLDAAEDRLSTDEQKLVLLLMDRLRILGRLPLGFVHGCLESGLVRGPEAHLSLRDFEESGFAPAVVDFARLACGPWLARPRLRNDFFSGYGRALSTDERLALRALTALHAVRTLAAAGSGPGHRQAAEDARVVLARLDEEVTP
ncbi:phosphotransferase [Streptomyces sp. NPDC056660]|uniref:phosphotransferase n=1 Tax=Streptomyces sp. NPDC056660 TaxID=3345897 RepID=UPI0036C078AC